MAERRLLPARRSPYDKEIWRLAVPAFGALAAEPLYVLVDTAIVGQLGTRQLAGLAVAGTVLVAAFSLFNFLAYSTTAAVARRVGAGDERGAAALGVDGTWLALACGVVLMVVGLAASSWIVDAMGASARVRPYALDYFLISVLGAPFMLVGFAGAGYLRGLQDTRPTMVIAVVGAAINLVLELLFVFGFDWGLAGSAWGTVIAQAVVAGWFVVLIVRSARLAGAPLRPTRAGVAQTAVVGGPLMVRTGSLLVVFITATALAARISDDAVAAHQIAYQTFLFLALSMDALAIAAQAMVGRSLGAVDAPGARAMARRMLEWGVVIGIGFGVVLAALTPWLVGLFSDDPGVQDLAEQLLLIVAVLQPLNAIVFVLDGVLIGAGDQRFLAAAMIVATFAVYAPAAVVVTISDRGAVALWGVLSLWFAARAVGLSARYVGARWQVTGAALPGSRGEPG